eukprot:1548310-Prorocentrum_lima.AAC.1
MCTPFAPDSFGDGDLDIIEDDMSRVPECLSDDNASGGDGHEEGSEEFNAWCKQFFIVFLSASGLTLISRPE